MIVSCLRWHADSNTCKTRDDLLCIDSVISGDSVCNGDSGGPLNYIVSLEEEAEISRSNETAAEESTTTSPEADNLNDIDGPTTIATSAFGPSLTFTSKRDALRRVAVVGVTSFGVGVFSFPNVIRIDFCTGPAAYTRVPYYKDFIEANIDKKNLCYA